MKLIKITKDKFLKERLNYKNEYNIEDIAHVFKDLDGIFNITMLNVFDGNESKTGFKTTKKAVINFIRFS